MRFTKKSVEELPTTGRRYAAFEEVTPGFAVRVGVNGNRSFYYVYRDGKGRGAVKRWLHLGAFPAVTVEQARALARKAAAQVAMGRDPASDVQEMKTALTVSEVMEQYLSQHGEKIKLKTLKGYRDIARLYIEPAIGKLKVKTVTFKHVAALHHTMRATPYAANRMAALLSAFFNWCEMAGYRERATNPVTGLERYKESKRIDFMGSNEIEALGAAMAEFEAHGTVDPVILAALKVLLLTGARCMEICTLKWAYIDRDHGVAHIPDSKTGARALALPDAALVIMDSLPKTSEYCFPGRGMTGHIVNVHDAWRRLQDAAGLSGWRIHDLRHAFASYAVTSGKSLPIIGKLLGHTQPGTTARYAHVDANPMRTAAEDTAEALTRDLEKANSPLR